MIDIDTLKAKINDLKSKVENDSITPIYVGNILDDLVKELEDMDAAVDRIGEHPVSVSDTDEAKLIISGEDQQPLLSVGNDGHIRTDAFDSSAIADLVKHPVGFDDTDICDFAVTDSDGNDIVRFANGHIQTKNFDSANIVISGGGSEGGDTSEHPVSIIGTNNYDFALTDKNGNDIVQFADGHIKTKNFDSGACDPFELSVMPMLGASDLCLLCFADIHGDAAAFKRIKAWRERYLSYLHDTIQLGDLCDVNATESISWFDVPKIMSVIGNHDIYSSGRSGDIGEASCFERYLSGIASWGVQYTANKCYYYKEYSKVRMIILDEAHWTTAQANWLTSTLTAAKSAGKAVIIMSHYPMSLFSEIECDFNPIGNPGIETPSSVMSTIASSVSSFVSSGGTFVAYVCGHTHNDIVATFNSGSQLMISIDSATPRPPMNLDLRVAGTKSQDSYTVIGVDTTRHLLTLYRIGNTINRHYRSKRLLVIDYETKEIITNY